MLGERKTETEQAFKVCFKGKQQGYRTRQVSESANPHLRRPVPNSGNYRSRGCFLPPLALGANFPCDSSVHMNQIFHTDTNCTAAQPSVSQTEVERLSTGFPCYSPNGAAVSCEVRLKARPNTQPNTPRRLSHGCAEIRHRPSRIKITVLSAGPLGLFRLE